MWEARAAIHARLPCYSIGRTCAIEHNSSEPGRSYQCLNHKTQSMAGIESVVLGVPVAVLLLALVHHRPLLELSGDVLQWN